jgi:hypothetical protein
VVNLEENLKQSLVNLSSGFPSAFKEIKPNWLSLEFIIAQRKAFLSTQKLTYKASLKIYDDKKTVNFFELLKESGAGLSVGGSYDDNISPGFGFKVEKTKYIGGGREGSIEEQSNLFGKKYKYNFDYAKIRKSVEEIVNKFEYSFNVVLLERHL